MGYNYDHLWLLKRKAMKSIIASEAKKKFLELIRNADESFERYYITRNGEPKAVLMSIDDYEGWLETLEIVSSKKAVAEIKKARMELDAGKGISFEKVLAKLR
jgi:antitoxin YefM